MTNETKRIGRPKRRRSNATLNLTDLQSCILEARIDGRDAISKETLQYRLQLSASTIDSLLASGELPVAYFGADMRRQFPRVLVDDLNEYLRRKSFYRE